MERSMERSGGGHGGQSVFPLSFWSLKTHEYALTATTSLALGMYLCCVYRDPGRVPVGPRPTPSRRRRAARWWSSSAGAARASARSARVRSPARAPPPPVQPLRFTHGPPLRLGEQLRRAQELQVFLLFLFYAVVSIWHAALLLASRAYAAARIVDERDPRSGVAIPRREDVSLGVAEVAALTLAAPLALALTMLFAWHCYLVSRNKTTIEHYEGVRAAAGAERRRRCRRCTPRTASRGTRTRWGFAPTWGDSGPARPVLARARVLHRGDGLAFANVAEYGKWARARARRRS